MGKTPNSPVVAIWEIEFHSLNSAKLYFLENKIQKIIIRVIKSSIVSKKY